MAKRKFEWGGRSSVENNARRNLPGLAAGYFEEVREFLELDRKPKRYHRLRLASKRLRYTLELFRPCYDKGLEERLDALKTLQDSLGDVNDAVATLSLLGKSADPKVRQFLKHRAREKAKEFREHWKDSFDAPGREKWWTDYLKHNAHPPSE